MKEVLIKIVKSNGDMFIIDGSEYIIPSKGLTGLDFANLNLYSTTLAFEDGSIITGSNYSSRNIVISFYNVDKNNNEKNRKDVMKFFNAKNNSYKIYITYQGVTRWIEGYINNLSCASGNVYNRINPKVAFFCPKPFFRSVDEFAKDLASVTPMWAFPYIDTNLNKPMASYYNFQNTVILPNDGDVETYFKAVIRFKGNCSNPKLMSGEHIMKVIGNFTSSDVLEIDFNTKNVLINGVKSNNKVTAESTFLDIKVPVGGGEISFDADYGDNVMSIVLYYNQLYGGM